MDSIEPASLLEANLRAGVTNKSHLQSLGFIMDNGRPRFKIDEPVRNTVGPNSLRSELNTLRSIPNSMDSEEESFVVLDKDSLASPLASYAQIQQTSISTDYNSIISSLTAEETEKKLKELLQENVKLKETLSQNNLAMKRQFNTLVAWQEEITKVHQSHKQKFSETKELISQLRRENSELKAQASKEPVTTSDYNLKVKLLEEQLQKTLIVQDVAQSTREAELEEVNSKLMKELADSKTACQRLTSDIHRYTVLSTRLSQQLKQADLTIDGLKLDLERLELNLKEKEQLASLADYSLLFATTKETQESETWKEKSQQQDKEIKYLRELIESLKQQLLVISRNSFPSIEIQTSVNCTQPTTGDRLQLMKNVKQYNDILKKLSEYYTQQGSSYVKVQECLKESIDTIQELEKIKSKTDANVNLQEKQDKLANYRVKLNDERLEMINERQELIKAQNQFQIIFSDYNSVLYELEIMHEENAKLSCLQKNNAEVGAQQETLLVSEKMVDNSSEERKLSKESEASILQATSDLREKEARDELLSECENLKTTLGRQKLLQEAEKKSFLAEKKSLEETIKDLKAKNKNLEQKLKYNTEQVNHLKAEAKSLKENSEKLPLLEAQLQVYMTDFQEERQARQRIVGENNKLLDEFEKFKKMHQDILDSLTRQRQSDAQQCLQQQYEQRGQMSASAPPQREADSDVSVMVITAYSCPKCSLSFKALRPLEEHVEECLDLE